VTSDPRAELSITLSEPGPAAPLLALRQAADWAARTVLTDSHGDDTAAFECLIALDDALLPVGELIAQVPHLVKLASVGEPATNRLTAVAAELARQRDTLAAERARLAALRETLDRLAAVESERDQLRRDMQRAERALLTERELPVLRERLAELTGAVSAAEAASAAAGQAQRDEVIGGLLVAGRRLLELTVEQLSLLEEGNDQLAVAVADVVATAEQSLARRDQLTAELETRDREMAELKEEQEKILPALRARRQADADLVAGLAALGLASGADSSPLDYVRAELAEFERRLADAEGQLRPLFRQHQQAYEEASQVRGLNALS
jgi:hypothetical protein